METSKKEITRYTPETSIPLILHLQNDSAETQKLFLFSKPFPENLYVELIVGEKHIIDYPSILDKNNEFVYGIVAIVTDSNNIEQSKNAFLYVKKDTTFEDFMAAKNKLDLIESTIMDVPDIYSANPTKMELPCDILIGDNQDVYYEVLPNSSIHIYLYPSEKIKN